MKKIQNLPKAESCRLLDFKEVDIRPGFVTGTYILIVKAIKPYKNMKVRLAPVAYIKKPKYWGIEVVGCLYGIGLPAIPTQILTIQLNNIRGTIGIKVIGATRSENKKIPPK
jgi:hypothetical protein